MFYDCDDLQAGKRTQVRKATTCSSIFYNFYVKFKLVYNALSGVDNQWVAPLQLLAQLLPYVITGIHNNLLFNEQNLV
jgi:hypothetical protein